MVKKHLNLYVDEGVINLARLDNVNMSELVNGFLASYLNTQSIEQLDKQILETKLKLETLQQRKADLIRSGISETRQEGMSNNIMQELQNIFSKRLEQFNDQYANEMWITSPRNIQKCKILGKEPLEVLAELNAWYIENNGGKTSK